MKHFIISSILSLVFFIPSTVYSLYPYPSFVKNCTSATFDGVNLIVVDCSAQLNVPSNQLHTLGQYTSIINDNSTTPTVIANCFFNNCGNIHAKSPVLFQNVVFNNSKYIGDAVSNTGLGGAAVLVDNTTATFTNVSFLNGYAR